MGYHNSHSFILNTNLIDRLMFSSDTSHEIINDIAHIMFKFIYSSFSNKFLLSTYCVLSTILGSGDSVVRKSLFPEGIF